MERPTQKKKQGFDVDKFLGVGGEGRTIIALEAGKVIFAQGDPANAVFYIHKGKIKVTVVSKAGKEAVIAVLGSGDFFGEGCLALQQLRMATATTMSQCSMMRLE